MNNNEREAILKEAMYIICERPSYDHVSRFAVRVEAFLETLEPVVKAGSFNEFGTGY